MKILNPENVIFVDSDDSEAPKDGDTPFNVKTEVASLLERIKADIPVPSGKIENLPSSITHGGSHKFF